ncbi:reverse transcriptase domain-containing protein [Tanacetum coccineum]
MTHLLEKETPFIFSKECIEAFETLKMKLTQAPILVAPDWDLPFEIMCDASDFAVGAVLGQTFRPIHYQLIQYARQKLRPRLSTLHYNGKRITCRSVCFREIPAISCLVQKLCIRTIRLSNFYCLLSRMLSQIARWDLLPPRIDVVM